MTDELVHSLVSYLGEGEGEGEREEGEREKEKEVERREREMFSPSHIELTHFTFLMLSYISQSVCGCVFIIFKSEVPKSSQL